MEGFLQGHCTVWWILAMGLADLFGGKYLVFVSSHSVKMRGFSFLSWYNFLEKCVYYSIFEKITVNFTIKKSKNKHTFLKKYTNWENQVLSPRELSFLSFEESVFIFQFLNNKTHKCMKQNIIVHFNIQKLKNEHTFLKNYTNWES